MRDNPLWPEPPRNGKPCPEVTCTVDVTAQRHYGHCLHCRAHIGATTAKAWSRAVKARCPECGRPW